jgi:predicted amino acid dehydrogenase
MLHLSVVQYIRKQGCAMTESFEHYSIGETIPVLTARGSYSYVVAKPTAGSVDTRPVVLMATEDHGRMSLCNAMEDVAAIIMKREKFAKEDKAIWIETAENERQFGQVVQRPATMPSWGPEKLVVQLLKDLQQPAPANPETSPSLG